MKDSKIFGSMFYDSEINSIFSDEQLVANMLQVEVALAKVQGELGIIPQEAAQAIYTGLDGFKPDFDDLRAGTEKAGYPVIALISQLRDHIGGETADYIHWGATTQDIMDTAMILQVRVAFEHIESNLKKLILSLVTLADKNRNTLMAGRTHSQQALPITFGFKVANWLAPLLRHKERLEEMKARVLGLQLGGAVGTLAALGDQGDKVQEGLANELNLSLPIIPWHTQRDRVAETASWLSMLTGMLANIAQDVILLAQSEIGELKESADPSRGGSSTMPQKHNPIISEYILAAARTNASLLGLIHQAMIQEHERPTHSWQLEMLNFPQMVMLTGGALKNTLFVCANMQINKERMLENVRASNGLMLAEAVSFGLSKFMSRSEAKKIVRAACEEVLKTGDHLVDIIKQKHEVELDWESLKDESKYLGSTAQLIDQVLDKAQKMVGKTK